jgi:peptide/nickel transport system permease protein
VKDALNCRRYVAVGIAGIPAYARVVRSIGLSVRSAVYVDAARAMGASTLHILRRHLWPNAIEPAIALATVDVGRVILYVAALGFLGLGAAPPQAEWGLMLYEGRQYLAGAPWASMAPGLAIALTVVAVTLLGDAISDALGHRPAS